MGSRLSPEARARLEAARAIAQGKPAPAAAAGTSARGRPGRPANAPRATADAGQPSDQAPAAAAAGGLGRLLAVAVGLLVLGGAAAAIGLLGRGSPDLTANVATIQKGLLSGQADAAARKKAVVEVIRSADQMTRPQLDSARKALEEEWQRARDAAIDAYFAAPESDRERLAAEGVERTLSYRKLCFGLSPQAVEEKPRRQKPPKDKDRRTLFARYGEALTAQAKKRGIDLPEWQ